jgi:3-oxoacyl-[acyl-carrier protein] reductase
MRQRGFGRILVLGSSAGITGGTKNVAAYCASKAGIMTMAKAIASEYAASGVTANALAPTLINTQMIGEMRELAEQVPLGRLGEPDDIAGDYAEELAAEMLATTLGSLKSAHRK